MSTIYKIPAYANIDANTTKQLEPCFVTSTILHDYINSHSSQPFLINSSGHFTKEDVKNEFIKIMGDNPIGEHIQLYVGLDENDPVPTYPFFGNALAFGGFSANYYKPVTFVDNWPLFTNYTFVNNGIQTTDVQYGKIDGSLIRYGSACPFYSHPISFSYVDYTHKQMYFNITIFPDDVFSANGGINQKYLTPQVISFPVISVRLDFNNDATDCVKIVCTRLSYDSAATVNNWLNGLKVAGPGTVIEDSDNPYSADGTSGPGGGGGKYGDIDDIEATDIPELPSINAASLGLITLYNPSVGVVNSLASYLWSGMFDPASFKKLFADPMGCLIGLSVVPAIPSIQGSKNIMFGNSDTGISCDYLSSNYCNVDCGSVSVDEFVGSFLDYEPYCKLNLFLPYVGFVPLSADDIVGGSINVQYNVDVLSGHCVAFVKHSVKGVMYSYSGNCITNIPITSQSFTGALQSYYTGLAGIAGSALGALGSGGAGLVQTGAEIARTAANTVFDMHPTFQRSGSMGGAAAIMGVQTPFIVIQRPRFSVPNRVQKYVGQTSNITMNLSDCSGFTMCDYVHLDGISATSEEIMEMESMLKQGVIL